MKLEIKKIGDASGVILPKELMEKLDLAQGDWLHVTESSDGSLRLTPRGETFDEAMSLVDEIMVEYHHTLRALAQ